jgi:hypothetical protein
MAAASDRPREEAKETPTRNVISKDGKTPEQADN